MIRAWQALQWVAVTSMACGLLACPLKKASSDAGATDAAPAGSAEVEAGPTALAANEAEVTRYPDETAINHAPLTTRWAISNVRTQASNTGGELVAAIKSGTDVDKIAEHSGFFLVVFNDPSDASRKDMGWLSQAVFSPEPPYKRVTITCPHNQVAILLQGGQETCVIACAQDSACPGGYACDGDGVLSANGQPGNAVQFCRIGKRSGGTSDGGSPPPPPPPAVADAGPTPPPGPSKPLDVKKSANGTCPSGYGGCSAVFCRLQCGKDADCGLASAHCTAGFCLGPGAAPCAGH